MFVAVQFRIYLTKQSCSRGVLAVGLLQAEAVTPSQIHTERFFEYLAVQRRIKVLGTVPVDVDPNCGLHLIGLMETLICS
jgi:hypothetical protein